MHRATRTSAVRNLRAWRLPLATFLALGTGLLFAAEELAPPQKNSADQTTQKRLQFLKEAVVALKATSSEVRDPARLEFVDTPILRYNDATREFFDAGVWRLGSKGRPTALLTLEMYRRTDGTNFLMHEFTSLTPSRIAVDTDLGVHWNPRPADLTFQSLPDAPTPADTESRRLTQMRALARRFSAFEEYQKVKTTLRLLTQPIDRYTDPDAGIVDGALFALATGTNPEIVIFLEAGQEQWQYALARTSSAEVRVSLDGQEIKVFPNFVSEGRGGNYYAEGYPVEVAW